jgi:uncharacterized membrane protein HdeD (DUF308 family)
MDNSRKWLQQLVLGASIMVVGAFIFFQTKDFTMFLSIAIGIYVVVNGVVVLTTGMKTKFSAEVKKAMIIKGIVATAVGLIAIMLPLVFARITWTFVLYLLGILLVASAAIQIYLALELSKIDVPVYARAVEAGVSILMALLIFTMPDAIGNTILKVAGFIVFGYGLLIVRKAVLAHMHGSDPITD